MTQKEVLIVDDEEFIRDLLTDFLAMEGFTCHSAATADQAYAAISAAKSPFDLILLDRHLENSRAEIIMTRLSTMRVKSPIILLTGDHEVGLEEARKMGAADVIHKPFQIDNLLNHIQAILEPS
jgi:DNA-binding response OmpR family regulator